MDSEFDELVSDFSRFYILTLLYEGPVHGYKIISYFKSRVGKEISPSLVYPFLQKLEEKGLVNHSIKPVGKKDRKIFKLTKEGRDLCIGLFKRFAKLVSVTIEPSLNACANCGCKIFEGGHLEDINGEKTVFCCVHCANSYKKNDYHKED